MFARIAAVALALLTLAATPARADFADTLLDKLKVLPTGIDPDYIEMAHYAIRYPANAEVVFSRAAAQDYPFFAMVGAAKLAKDKTFPKVGKFTEAKCAFPITAIDEVFSQSGGAIDDAKGKSDSNSAMGAAKTYAANYAKAQNDQARQQAIDELGKNIPYFKDIAVICHFAFHTEFSSERNVHAFISQTGKDLRAAYNAFKKGDIADGLEHVIALGVTPELACAIVDQAVAGGAISNTPIIGDLANSLCKGIAGKVINGLKKVGSAVVCAVETLWGGCDDDTPPPPTGISEATKFCAPYGGIQSASSKTNQPNDYAVICNDGSKCSVKPGQKPRCATAAQIAARKQELIQQAAAEFNPGLVDWVTEFQELYTSQCPDFQCRGGMAFVRTAAVIEAKKIHEQSPDRPWHFIAFDVWTKYRGEAQKVLNDAKTRSATKMADSFEELVVAKWTKECVDQTCVTNITALAQKANDETLALQKAKPDMSNLALQGEIGRKYAPLYQAEIDASKKRVAIIADPNAPPPAKLGAMGCKNFLGRTNQYLCTDEKAWRQCVDYVKGGKADVCMSPQFGPYADAGNTASLLKAQGCVQQSGGGLSFKCTPDRPDGMEMCGKFTANGIAVQCVTGSLADSTVPPAARLGSMGCKSFLGRANQYLCPDDQAFQQCIDYVKVNKAELCMSPKHGPYANAASTVAMLKGQGCAQQGNGMAFACDADKQDAMTMCNKFKANGQAVVCNVASATDMPAPAKLGAMGCKSFLGRANQYLCEDEQAWRRCVDYVKANKAEVCMSPKFGPYADATNTVHMLKLQGCAQQGNGLAFACDAAKQDGMTMCNKFKANGEAVVCNVAAQTPAQQMAGMGCKNFLGRANQYLCQDEKAWQQCKTFVDKDQAEYCASPHGNYADIAKTVAMLKSQDCIQQGSGLVFACPANNQIALKTCNNFKDGRPGIVCNVAAQSSEATMAGMGCKKFLGRANEYLCEDDKAFQQCKIFVDKNQAEFCASPKFGNYADMARTVAMLKNQDCVQQGGGLAFTCPANNDLAMKTCNNFKNGRPGLVCNVAAQSPAATMAAMGCKNFLGRANQYLCQDAKAFQQCKTYVDKDQAEYCASSFGTYADLPTTISTLEKQECKRQGNNGLVFSCEANNKNAMAICNNFKNGRPGIVCTVAANANKSPAATLGAMGCKSYLGRANQYLCENENAFRQCIDFVKTNRAELCMSPKFGPYADEQHTIGMLKSQGCNRQGTTGLMFKCAANRPDGLSMCFKFRTNGQPVVCSNN